MTRNTNTVTHHLSGADSVLPLLAGWEKTESSLYFTLRRSSHEAYHPARRIPVRARAFRRSVAEALAAFWSRFSVHLLEEAGGC